MSSVGDVTHQATCLNCASTIRCMKGVGSGPRCDQMTEKLWVSAGVPTSGLREHSSSDVPGRLSAVPLLQAYSIHTAV